MEVHHVVGYTDQRSDFQLEEMDLTQKEFSKRTGIAESTISDWRLKTSQGRGVRLLGYQPQR